VLFALVDCVELPYSIFMNNAARIQTLHTAALTALDNAFASETVGEARTWLGHSLAAVQELARIGGINPALPEAVNETRVALMARGWV